jgi:hypothetical protein
MPATGGPCEPADNLRRPHRPVHDQLDDARPVAPRIGHARTVGVDDIGRSVPARRCQAPRLSTVPCWRTDITASSVDSALEQPALWPGHYQRARMRPARSGGHRYRVGRRTVGHAGCAGGAAAAGGQSRAELAAPRLPGSAASLLIDVESSESLSEVRRPSGPA